MSATAPSASGGPLQRRLVEAGLVACLAGLLLHRTWQALPAARFGESLLLAALWAGLAVVVQRFTRLQRAEAAAAVGLALLVLMAGPAAVLAAALLVAAAIALGSLFVDEAAAAFVVGLALVAGIAGWLLPLPVHFAWTWGAVLAIVVLLRRRALVAQTSAALAQAREAMDASPGIAFAAVLALGLASAGTWLPTLQYDDLAYHLGLPWQLARNGRYALDASQQVWALAPWAGDVVQGIAQVLAGGEARGAVNTAWLVSAGALAMRAAGAMGAPSAARWMALALVATLPPIATLAGGMQTELPASAVLLGLLVLALGPSGPRRLLAVALLAGLLAGLKPLHAVAGLALVTFAFARTGRGTRPAAIVAAISAFTLVAGSSYAYAAATCGNPLLPLFNATFRSPCFASVDFGDPRWQAVPGLPLPWSMTFLTRHHLEGWNGGLGLVPIAFAGVALAACMERRTRGPAIAALFAVLVPMAVLPYARYIVPGLVLLLPVAAATVARLYASRRAILVLAVVAVADLAFQANAGWVAHTGGPKRALAAGGRDAPLFARYAPERLVIARLRTSWPEATVLDLGGAAHAELAGRGRTSTWYAPVFHARAVRADRDPSGAAWARLLRDERIDGVLLRGPDATPARRAGLQQAGAHRAMTEGQVEFWALPRPATE